MMRTKCKPLGDRALDFVSGLPVGPDVVVLEQMVHYPLRVNSKEHAAKANDLLDLQAIGSAVAGFLRPKQLVYMTARDWKGTVPKEVTQERVRATLTAKELGLVEEILGGIPKNLQHNVYDTLGLGLKFLKRKKIGKGVLTVESGSAIT